MSYSTTITTVLLHKDDSYAIMDEIRAAKRLGGDANRAADKVSKARTDFEALGKTTLKSTNNGETRIKNCFKYDLGKGYRLVTLQKGPVCLFLYFGDHDSTQKWIENNKEIKLTINKENKIELIRTANRNDYISPKITHDNLPYLQRLDNVDWEAIIPKRSIRRHLLRVDENSDLEEITDLIDDLQEEDAKLSATLHKVINHLSHNRFTQASSEMELYTGAAQEVSDTGEELTPEVVKNINNSSHLIELSNLSEEEWESILDPTRFQDWMVFLHPGQKRVVDEDFETPALLTGIPGSGKTCVLVHRARRMVSLYPGERVLILTLNKNLARLIEQLVSKLCSEEETRMIDVMSFHDYLASMLKSLDLGHFLKQLGQYLNLQEAVESLVKNIPPAQLVEYLFKAQEEEDLIEDFRLFLTESPHSIKSRAYRLQMFIAGKDGAEDVDFYLYEELELVRSAFAAFDDYKGYMEYERHGRSIGFQENRRKVVLSVLKAWEDYQIRHGFLDHMGLCQTALLAIEETDQIPSLFRYRSVLVDEFQDFSTLDFNILQRIPTAQQNGLFITGDFSQKLYAKELNLPKANLGPKDRTSRSIRQNYRNSRQILEAAHALITTYPPRLTEEEAQGILNPEYAKRESAVPRAIHTETPIEEAWKLAQDWVNDGNIGFSVCIATANRDKYTVDSIIEACPESLQASKLSGDYLLSPNKIVVSDITSIKGFEFSLVIIVGMGEGSFPLSGRPTEEHWRDALRLHVAISRARDEVVFVHQDEPSPFLIAMDKYIRFSYAEPILPAPEPIEPEPVQPALDTGATAEDEIETGAPADEDEKQTTPESDPVTPKDDSTPPSDEVTDGVEDTVANENQSPEDRPTRYSIQIINGFTVCSIPRSAGQRLIAEILGKKEIDITSYCQQELQCFVSPTAPLQEYRITKIMERYGCLVNFIN